MTKKKALLVEIVHPESDILHRIMCGPGFTFLRRESGGRDLFGMMHDGKEYLFFPLGCTFHNPTTLALEEPLGAEFFHRNMEGAKVTFKALNGRPFFEGAPGDFFQSSGTLKFDENGGVLVNLEHFVPWEEYDARAESEKEFHQAPPPPRHVPTDSHDHHHEHDGQCCHGHHQEQIPPVKVTTMNDQEHVEAVVAASRVLNIALRRAALDGVETRLLITREDDHDSVSISHIQRVIRLWKGST